jgi:hypothetical protein
MTDVGNNLSSSLTHNQAAIHIDHEYAKTTEIGKPLINLIFTPGLVVGHSVQGTTLGTTVSNVGWEEVALAKPILARGHHSGGNEGCRPAGEQVAADAGDRRLRTPRAQPARRGWLQLSARRARAEEANMTASRPRTKPLTR